MSEKANNPAMNMTPSDANEVAGLRIRIREVLTSISETEAAGKGLTNQAGVANKSEVAMYQQRLKSYQDRLNEIEKQ